VDGVTAIVLNIIGGIAVLVLVFYAGRASQYISRRAGTRYLRTWLGCNEVFVVLPSFSKYCGADEFLSSLPSNVEMMPVPEGAAIVDLIKALEASNRRLKVRMVRTVPDQPNGVPIICIGGPSVNAGTEMLLKRDHREFSIQYPEHVVEIEGRRHARYKPRINDNRETTEDWGFVATGLVHNAPYVLLFGVHSQGTWAAVHTFISLREWREHQYRRQVSQRQKLFIVSYTPVDGLQIDQEELTIVHPQPIQYG
jgi:hypothetical protein